MDPVPTVSNPLDLERILNDERAGPRYLRISLLESITNNFSDDLIIGSGGFAFVYKGLLENGEVAVKKLTQILDMHETKFRQEVYSLMRVKHKNIVRFLGYCSDTQAKMQKINGKDVMAEERQRFLCFEYLPWTLDKYIKDELGIHEWRTCYRIIKGICEGLHYLHQKKIVHLDLKLANILLDHNMEPKITDFGLSKCFEEKQTRAMTSKVIGTPGYMAPEFYGGQITLKSDIYSLGIIIIEILTGNKGCPDIENVLEGWSIKLKTSPRDTQLRSIRVCAEIGIECTDYDPTKRPDTWRILERLDEMESTYGVIKSDHLSPSSKTNASTSVFQMVDNKIQPLFGSEPASPLQTIIRVPMGLEVTHTKPNITATNAADNSSNGNSGCGPTSYWSRLIVRFRVLLFLVIEWLRRASFRDPAEFSFAQLKAATVGFAPQAEIGMGSYGMVYHGKLRNRREVAIKRDGRRLKKTELAFLCSFNHKNLVNLVGHCQKNKECLLVYQYMKNGTLYDHLHPKAPSTLSPVVSSWKLRIKILLDASRGIDFLHSYLVPPIIHRDVKSSNIMLDADGTARVSDFFPSLMREASQAVEIAGTPGYLDPEYFFLGHLTFKSDVYSFGVVMLEVLTGKHAIFKDKDARGGNRVSVVDYTVPSIVLGELGNVLDPRVPKPVAHEAEAVEQVAFTAVHCVRLESKDRPAMAEVVAKLETAFALVNDGDCSGGFGNSYSGANLCLSSMDQWEGLV